MASILRFLGKYGLAGTVGSVLLPLASAANGGLVRGTVTDANEEPVAGAVVYLEDEVSLQVWTFLTQRDGAFHFRLEVSNRDYTLKARYRRFASATVELSRFDEKPLRVVRLPLKEMK